MAGSAARGPGVFPEPLASVPTAVPSSRYRRRDRRRHPLVRRRQGHADERLARRCRRSRPAPPGCPGRRGGRRCPSRTRRGWPTGRGSPRCARCGSRAAPGPSRRAVRRAAYRSRCSRHVRVVAERGHDRRLGGRRGHHAAVLADLQQLAEDRRVTGEEGRAVAGEVGALGERVDGDDPLVRAAAHVRVQHGDRVGLPAELQVALVGEDQHAVLAGPGDVRVSSSLRQHPARGVRGRVEPEQLAGRSGSSSVGSS